MEVEQGLIFGILALTMGLFLWGKLRHDVVALAALMASAVVGVVPMGEVFLGFGHPAVITVACVLVLSRGLQSSGAVDLLARRVLPRHAGRLASLAALAALGAFLSGFMNNVGAMALLMPVAVQLSKRLGLTPGQVLMPLAFGTILGGMTTLVGTPPNLIVSGYRLEAGRGEFGMFDFTPVGLSVAVAGILFVAVLGWRLVPAKRGGSDGSFEIGHYLTEARVPEKSKAAGLTLRELEAELSTADAQVLALVRNEVRMNAPRGSRKIQAGDILVLEADVEGLGEVLAKLGLKLEEAGSSSEAEGAKEGGDKRVSGKGENDKKAGEGKEDDKNGNDGESDDIVVREVVVRPGSSIVWRSAGELLLRSRFGLNLLAISRDGKQSRARLRAVKLRSGDVLLMQGPADVLAEFVAETGCVPLAEREVRIPDRGRAILSVAIMAGSIGLVTFGVLPAAVSFALGVLASMVVRTVPPRAVYPAIDWPVIVLLAALLPVAGAMQSTGAAELLARFLVDSVAQGNAVGALVLILVVTMFLSDVMNNAATAAVMCPIALGIAESLGVSADSFLMAVAIGASCAFLTPIGHQNNTLILGPGGFQFGDYWRLGLPLEAVVVVVSVPLLLWVWPL
jgi:di/tricarboxylate transporter